MTARPASVSDVSSGAASRFVAASGFVIDEISEARLTGHVDLGEDHLNPWGVVHGGLYTTIVESAGGVAASQAVAERGQFAVGVHNATDFLRPSRGGRASVEAEALQQGRTQQLWQVVITDDATSKVLARGQVRLQNVPLPGSIPS
ncbi:PaaI family thioesterase [Aeromicrobium sp. HA]|uniref:PaaI family thioesterase n=1 Tax=Aeromicrobium sp. HA TaxID=3009077 RepID=UPI0022AE9F50|nr:PaaI family thioesterase [Aeromicrobium sp. HA]